MVDRFKSVAKGVVKRNQRRSVAVFIDGIGLDRATRRLERKVDFGKLLKGVTSGLTPIVARYYTVIPHEDDARQFSYLDAVAKAGFQVVTKRLPPKGVQRQVTSDVEMASDIIAFARGFEAFSDRDLYKEKGDRVPEGVIIPRGVLAKEELAEPAVDKSNISDENESKEVNVNRIVTVVCPTPDLIYPLQLAREIGADTVTADFTKHNTRDVLKSANKWIDLSDSETIWRD